MDSIADVSLSNLFAVQQMALMRLMLLITGLVQERLLETTKDIRAAVLAEAETDGKLTVSGAYRAQVSAARVWGDTLKDLQRLIEAGIREGASLPFGVQAAYHDRLIVPAVQAVRESVVDGVFETQLQLLINAAYQDSGPDGLQFSSRIWRFDREAREGINLAIMNAVTEQKSAWQLAQDLGQYLGAGQDCPRWTYARLNSVTSVEKAKGVTAGLIGGDDCAGQGVAYKALRLARTEIQKAHHLANDNRMKSMPWIEKERIVLSASHPEPDICDEVVNGGENNKGIYPVGTIVLPLHPHCFCDKRAVQDLDAFGEKLGNWVRTGQGFPAMDAYANSLGAAYGSNLGTDPVAVSLGIWAFDKIDELRARLK